MQDDVVITFIRDWLWAPLLALVAWAWDHHTKRVDKLHKYVDDQCEKINSEVLRQRDVSGKIFEKLEEHGLRSEKRHIELLKALHDGLDKKMDKP